MFNAAAMMNSGNGKMKWEQTPATANQSGLFNFFGGRDSFVSPNDPRPPDGRHSQVQQILNTAAPAFKPLSFMSLLTAEDEDYHDALDEQIKSQSEQVDQMILLQTDILKQALGTLLEKHHKSIRRAADERAAKKLEHKETELQIILARTGELEKKAEHYKNEANRLQIKVRHLERATMSLRSCLEEANAARRYAETQEEAQSSFEDPGSVGPVRLSCKLCETQMATVMMWPCCHVSICKRCDAIAKVCPVCLLMKTTSVEVYLPLD